MIFTGVFFEKKFETKLDKTIAFPHVTFQFKPKEIDKNLFGQEVTFKVVAHGINEDNEGFLVEIVEATEEMKKAFNKIERPHITIGVSNKGKAVNTKNLEFKPCDSFILKGRFGGFEKNKIIF